MHNLPDERVAVQEHDENHECNDRSEPTKREPLWTLFRVVFTISAVSWGGLALMAQLEQHYVRRERRLSQPAFSDFVALAWMVPGPVGCNVAVQLGHALRGRAGAWVAGVASVLPFFILMTAFAIFYRTPFVHAVASPTLLNHFSVVLGMLIGVTWWQQTRALVRGRLEWGAALAAVLALALATSGAAYVGILCAAFCTGWVTSPARAGHVEVGVTRSDLQLLAVLAVLIALFALPLPHRLETWLLWPRLAGAGMTLFGGGFSALPVLKTLFVSNSLGVTNDDFTLAFSLSPLSPGPLLNVVPFFGYLVQGWHGALIATLALFAPSGCLVVLAQRHVRRMLANARFEHAMRVLRAATTAFLAIAVWHIALRVPRQPAYLLTAVFAAMCFGRFKLPAYAVYATVGLACGAWLVCA